MTVRYVQLQVMSKLHLRLETRPGALLHEIVTHRIVRHVVESTANFNLGTEKTRWATQR